MRVHAAKPNLTCLGMDEKGGFRTQGLILGRDGMMVNRLVEQLAARLDVQVTLK